MRLTSLTLFLGPLPSAQSAIDGSVINSFTRAGIEGVTVRFYTQKGVRYDATTLSDGSFHIVGVAQGDYRHTLELEGFEPPPGPKFPEPESVTQINGKDPVRVVFEMTAWTALRGRVVDADGKPAPGVKVVIRGPLPPKDDVQTGSDGSFEFSQLRPGAYTLFAQPDLASLETANAVPVNGARMETVPTYYPSAVDPSQAQPVLMRGAGYQSGLEIHLRRVLVHGIRGVVLDAGDKPAAGITVSLSPVLTRPSELVTSIARTEYYLPGHPSPTPFATELTSSGGVFEFPTVPEGEWNILATSEWRYEEATRRDLQQMGQARAFLRRDDGDSLEIHLSTNFDFSASTKWPDNTPSEARWAMVVLLPEDAGLQPPSFGMAKPDGTIQFDRVYASRYIVAPTANGMSNSYVAEVRFGGRDVLGQTIELTPTPPPMQIVYKSGAGVVKAQFENGISGTFVLIPGSAEGGYPRSVPCDGKGPCQFSGLRPGDYFAVGFDRVDGLKLSDPAYASSLISLASRVRVEENGNESVNLSLHRWPD